MREHGYDTIEPTQLAEARLGAARQRLRRHHAPPDWPTRGTSAPTCPASRACSCPTSGGVDGYRLACEEVVADELPRLPARGPRAGTMCRRCGSSPAARREDGARHDGRVAAAHHGLDVGRPTRACSPRPSSAMRPPGPDVGEIVDGTLPGADGATLDYRLYRPAIARPAPHRRLLPRRRLGHRQPGVRRPVLPRPVRAVRGHHRVGQLPPRPRGPVPCGRRRRTRGRAMDRRPR